MEILTLKTDEMRGKKPFLEPIENVYIAGGAVRKWFTGQEKDSDLDVFAVNDTALEKFKIKYLKEYQVASSNKMTTTFKKDDKIVQLISGRFYANVNDLFDSFDFTLCHFAWTTQGIFGTKEGVISTLRNHLAVHKLNKDFAVDSLRRAFKYHKKGFEPCWGTLRDLTSVFQTLTQNK